MGRCRLTTFAGVLAVALTTVILIAVLTSSFVRVTDDEACEVHYPDGGETMTQDKPGLVFLGPGIEKHCYSRATQHFDFSRLVTEGLGRKIRARSQEGVLLDLDVDIEYRYDEQRVGETALRLGYEHPQDRLQRTARAEVRNVAGTFQILDFLTGSRELIAFRIQEVLQNTFRNKDGVHVDVIKVNLQHIEVDAEFRDKFQDVEDKRLAQLVAREQLSLVTIDEKRLNETLFIRSQALRNQRLRQAEADIVNARLSQRKELTEGRTAAQQASIVAESDRVTRLIRARTRLDETKAQRELKQQQARRSALALLALAETDRQNMEVVGQGNISRALANRTRDLSLAEIDQTRQLEALVSRGIEQSLATFRIALQANLTAQASDAQSRAEARSVLTATRARTSEFVMLQSTLSLSDRSLVGLLLHRGLHRSNKTVLLDYTKQPFFLELARHPTPPSSAQAVLE